MDIKNATMVQTMGDADIATLLEIWLELSEVLAAKPRTIIPIVYTP